MKGKFKPIFALVLAASMTFAAGCGSNNAGTSGGDAEKAADPIELIAVSGFNDGHHYFIGSVDPVMNKVTEDTDGQVTFKKYLSGELVGHAAEYDALSNGICDFAMSMCPSYDSSRFVLSDVVTLPGFDATLEDIDKAYVAMLDSTDATMDGKTFYDYEYGSKGLMVFPNHMTDTYHIITVSADPTEMSTYATSTTMRTPTRMTSILANDLGFSSVTMTISDAYDALSKGAVSGMLMCADWKQYGLDSLYGYIVDGVNLGNAPTVMMMTKEKFDSLPQAAQDDLVNYSRECTVTSGVKAVEANNEINWQSAKDNGVAIIQYSDLSADIQQHITDSSAKVWLDWIDATEKDGYPAKEAAIVWRNCLVAQGVTIPDTIANLESYEPNK